MSQDERKREYARDCGIRISGFRCFQFWPGRLRSLTKMNLREEEIPT